MDNNNNQPRLNLRKVMNQKNVSDQWLADQIGVSRQSVSKMINGHTDPPLSRLYDIANALNVMITELFGEGGVNCWFTVSRCNRKLWCESLRVSEISSNFAAKILKKQLQS